MAGTFLDRIMPAVRARLAERQTSVTLAELRDQAATQPEARDFAAALRSADRHVRVIAEIKRASPSRGVLDAGLDPATLAKHYMQGGAAAISVLTEQDHFQGTLDDLRAVWRITALSQQQPGVPVLRKDFIVDPYQVIEARAAGADSYLLIVALLGDGALRHLIAAGRAWGMEPLVEVHDGDEARRAVAAGAQIIGVNARDLRTFQVDTTLLQRLRSDIPAHCVVVAESGLFTQADVARMRGYGADAVLIGEALVRAGQPHLLERITALPRVVRSTRAGVFPVIKLCGMRTPEDALAAVAAGADLIGIVLTKSKRQVSAATARSIVAVVPPEVLTVGVFADEPPEIVHELAMAAGVQAIQVANASEPPPDMASLPLPTILALSSAAPANAQPQPERIAAGQTVMLEAAPPGTWGGTGQVGNWEIAAHWASELPILLAGGLTAVNVANAIRTVRPWGVDVSSGIEGPDGQKDPARMRTFVQAARGNPNAEGAEGTEDTEDRKRNNTK